MTAFFSPPFLISNWSSVKGEWFLRYKVGCWRQRMAGSSTTLIWWARAGLQDLNISFTSALFGKKILHCPSALKTETTLKSAFFYCQYLQAARGQKKQTLHFLCSECTFLFLKYLSVHYWGKPFLSLTSAGIAVLPLRRGSLSLLRSSCASICFFPPFEPHSIKINVKFSLNSWLCEQPSTKALWYDRKLSPDPPHH